MKPLNTYIQEAIINKVLTLDDIVIDYIDLGLKSGTLWATCNIGAKRPEEYGLYFQWGAVTGYKDASHSTWETCPFNNGNKNYDGKYFKTVKDKVCPRGILGSKYDAAYIDANGKAHIPSVKQLEELKELNHECAELNGVKGLKIIGNNGNSIFIPAAGYNLLLKAYNYNERVYIWGSSFDPFTNIYVYHFRYFLDSKYYNVEDNFFRYGALPIRAVKDK